MFDTWSSKKFCLTMTFLMLLTGMPTWILAIPRWSGGAVKGASAAAKARKAAGHPAAARPAPARKPIVAAASGFDHCIQDDTDPSKILRFSATTGALQFTQCDLSSPITFTATGTVKTVNGCPSLSYRGSNGTVSAGYTNGCTSASASLNVQVAAGVFESFKLQDTNTLDDTCGTTPVVALAGPNGGEILDAGSNFTIVWGASDSVSILSQDLLYSTDGGSTYNAIATGLAPNITTYNWTVPSIPNNQELKIRVVAHDASCDSGVTDSASTFTVWNPGMSFTHLAEAPFFVSGPNISSTIYLANTSANPVIVELDPHKPDGDATQNLPTQITLAGGTATTLDAASLYTIAADPNNSAVQSRIQGGIRLRHNGTQDGDVRAYIVAQGGGQRFTTQFSYPASAESASGTTYCAPMYYTDDNTDAYVAIQNATNSPVSAVLTCNYGTGISGTPNGQYQGRSILLGPQETSIVNLAAVWDLFNGAEWGSMDITTSAPQSIVCHSVMMSTENRDAWDCPFVDPAMSVSTTKAAQGLSLDYNSAQNAYVMVCNMAGASRTVTASFDTNNGVSIPAVQITVPAGGQQMITLNAQQLLSSGGSTTGDVRLSYSGGPSDIQAAGCSLSDIYGRATPIKFKETSSADSRRLTSPYFNFNPGTSGQIQISNLSSSSVTAGAKMTLANQTVVPLKTPAVTVPAGGIATIDLSSAGDMVPAGADAAGRVDLVQSGSSGAVTAAVITTGVTDNSGQVVPLDPGPPPDPFTMFTADYISPGGCATIDAVTDGSITNPCDPSLLSTDGCLGTASGWVGTGPNAYRATFCVPIACSGSSSDVHIVWQCSGGGGGGTGSGGDEVDLKKAQLKPRGFSTDLGVRMRPDGTTHFTITASGAFPNANLQVKFNGPHNSFVSTTTSGDGQNPSITGVAPVNHVFLGGVKNIEVDQLNPDGSINTTVPRVLLAKNTGAYFALDKPTSVVSVTPNSIPVTGGSVTITGAGFQTWLVNGVQVNPTVFFGEAKNHEQIGFTVLSVSTDQKTMTGVVGATPADVKTCPQEGLTPCKNITVINPGGSDGVDDLTNGPYLTIQAPPAPILTAISGTVTPQPQSDSIGAVSVATDSNGFSFIVIQGARIFGQFLSRVRSVSIGNQRVLNFTVKNDGEIDVGGVPSACIGSALVQVGVSVFDKVNPPVTLANAWTYTAVHPVHVTLPGFNSFPYPNWTLYIVGPCEGINATYQTLPTNVLATDCTYQKPSCVTLPPPPGPGGTLPTLPEGKDSVRLGEADIVLLYWAGSCGTCPHQSTPDTGYFPVVVSNTVPGVPPNSPACFSASCSN